MRISVIGLGYIGLPTALIAAELTPTSKNISVFGYDIDEEKIEKIKQGICPFEEPKLEKFLKNTKLRASTKLESADFFIVAVPTPFTKEKCADLSYVMQAAEEISKKIVSGNTVILESTIPVGTTERFAKKIERITAFSAKKDFFVAHCPERVLPGKIFHELVHNDRIIGGICENSTKKAYTFYKNFVKGNCFLTDSKSAEMTKLVENSFRDINIALANQVSEMCNKTGINPHNVIKLANKHPRVNILEPGCGVGGHCIAVDPWFLIKTFPKSSSLLQEARNINDEKPKKVIAEVINVAKNFKKNFNKKPRVLALGKTFKPDVDDTRNSPALFITEKLSEYKKLFFLKTHDPFIDIKPGAVPPSKAQPPSSDSHFCLKTEIENHDIIVILVKHSYFLEHKKDFFGHKNKFFIDPCGLLNCEKTVSHCTRMGKYESNFFEEWNHRDRKSACAAHRQK